MLRAWRFRAIHPVDHPAPPTLRKDHEPASNRHADEVDIESLDHEPDGRAYPDELGDGPDLAFRRWLPDLRGRPTSS